MAEGMQAVVAWRHADSYELHTGSSLPVCCESACLETSQMDWGLRWAFRTS